MVDAIKLRRTVGYDLYLTTINILRRSQSDFKFATSTITEIKMIKAIMGCLFKLLNLPMLISSRMS
jgi:hypothetical protein